MTTLDTWRIYESSEGLYWTSSELPITAIAGHPYLEHVAPVCLYNGKGSGVKLHVTRAEGASLIIQETALPTVFQVQRITAQSGGTALTSFKLDTASADLPTQITAAKYATITGADVFRRIPDFPRTNVAQSRGLAELSTEFSRWGLDPSSVWDSGYHDSTVQPITLNEGEGLAVSVPATRLNSAFGVTVLFSTADGTYGYNDYSRPKLTEPLFSMFNGAGSGRTVSVWQVQIYELAEDNVPHFSTERIDGISDTGTVLTPIPMDTANTALPAEVVAYRNARVMLHGSTVGALITNPILQRRMATCIADGVASATAFAGERVRQGRRFDTPIVLSEGQGLAILKRQSSKIGEFEFKFEFGVETVSGAATSTTLVMVCE